MAKSVPFSENGRMNRQLPLALLVFASFVQALLADDLPERGMWSDTPARIWQEALVTGNGRMGVLVFGDPHDERVVFNHERLYEPLLDRPVASPNVADAMPELRRLLLAGEWDAARRHFAKAATDAGYGGLLWTDPYHPAMAMRIEQPKQGTVRDYSRSTDFETGEVAVRWRDDAGRFVRRTFVSRPDNVVVQQIGSTDGGKVRTTFRLVNQDQRSAVERDASYNPLEIENQADSLFFRCNYQRSDRAYFAVTRVIASPGSCHVIGDSVAFAGKRLLLLTRIVSVEDRADAEALESEARESLSTLPDNYEALLKPHAAEHGAMFGRVSLDLGGGVQRQVSTEELIAAQKASPDRIVPALLEKMFDMGRYSFICSSGEWPPNLMGLFNGEWRPKWSGDFTLDANVNLQIAAANLGAMGEGMDGYANLLEGIADDWRTNARNLFGCRGMVSGTRTDGRHNLNTHHTLGGFPGFFWTAGAQWLVTPLYEHYLMTGDKEFARERLLPLTKGIVAFYEDFLVERDANGKLIFVPSYSPENQPANTKCPVAINATMDIACAREACTQLASLCHDLQIEPETIERCEKLLAELPPYLVNEDGALKEWAWPTLADRYNHRHVSHLYPVWPGHEINPEETPELFTAAKVAAAKRGRGNGSAHGLAHMALIGTRLKDAELVHGNLLFMLTNNYVLPSLFTYHNPGEIYNADMLHSLPAVVLEMLVYSKPGEIELLPALSEAFPTGRVEGIRCRGQIAVERLEWDLPSRRVEATITSMVDQSVRLRMRRGMESVVVEGGGFVDGSGRLNIKEGTTAELMIEENVPIRLTIQLR